MTFSPATASFAGPTVSVAERMPFSLAISGGLVNATGSAAPIDATTVDATADISKVHIVDIDRINSSLSGGRFPQRGLIF